MGENSTMTEGRSKKLRMSSMTSSYTHSGGWLCGEHPFRRPPRTRLSLFVVDRAMTEEEYDLLSDLLRTGVLRRLAVPRNLIPPGDLFDDVHKIRITVEYHEPHPRFPVRYTVPRRQVMRPLLEAIVRDRLGIEVGENGPEPLSNDLKSGITLRRTGTSAASSSRQEMNTRPQSRPTHILTR